MRQDEAQGAGTTLADFVAATVWADIAAQTHEAVGQNAAIGTGIELVVDDLRQAGTT